MGYRHLPRFFRFPRDPGPTFWGSRPQGAECRLPYTNVLLELALIAAWAQACASCSSREGDSHEVVDTAGDRDSGVDSVPGTEDTGCEPAPEIADTGCGQDDTGWPERRSADAFIGAGETVGFPGDVDGDGHGDLVITDLAAIDNKASTFLLLGPVVGDVRDIGEADARLVSEGKSLSWVDFASGADMDGDGLAEILVGDGSHLTDDCPGCGAVYVVPGDVRGTWEIADAAVAEINGDETAFGEFLAGADMDGDGLGDLAIGCNWSGCHSWYVPGPVSGLSQVADVGFLLYLDDEDATISFVDAGGDSDGDGLADLLVGAQLDDTLAENGGAVYLLRGGVAADTNLADADATFFGFVEGSYLSDGRFVGDVDGDGLDDVLAPSFEEVESVNLFLAPFDGERSAECADARLEADVDGLNGGIAIARAGDIDGDGFADLLVGNASESETGRSEDGAVWLAHGPLTGRGHLDCVGTRMDGARDSRFGYGLAGGDDLDGDGFDDFAASGIAYGWWVGHTHVFLGRDW